jgi:SAM-dependent methyltransferase
MVTLRTIAKQVLPKNSLPLAMEITGALQSIWYVGEEFTCPCCNGKFRQFITAGVNNRLNARCPKCNSFERHRLLWLYLKRKTNLFTDKLRVLHICPEYFFQKNLKSMPNIEYIGAGLAAPFATVEMDITDIDEPDNSYDVILCNHVLEHVQKDYKALKELFRVLKSDGWAILQVPVDFNREETFEDPSITSPKDREIYFGKDDHVRVYGLDYKNRLEKAGFRVKVEDYAQELGTEMIKQHCLQKKDDIYFCTKPINLQ